MVVQAQVQAQVRVQKRVRVRMGCCDGVGLGMRVVQCDGDLGHKEHFARRRPLEGDTPLRLPRGGRREAWMEQRHRALRRVRLGG